MLIEADHSLWLAQRDAESWDPTLAFTTSTPAMSGSADPHQRDLDDDAQAGSAFRDLLFSMIERSRAGAASSPQAAGSIGTDAGSSRPTLLTNARFSEIFGDLIRNGSVVLPDSDELDGDFQLELEELEHDEDGEEDDEDYVEEVEEDEEDDGLDMYFSPPQRPGTRWQHTPITEPKKEGLDLLFSGEFGRIQHQVRSRNKAANVAKFFMNRSTKLRPSYTEDFASDILPNSDGTAVASYQANAYVGQYSSDSSFYYTCVRDFRLHVYDTSAPIVPRHPSQRYMRNPLHDVDHETSMKVIKTIAAQPGGWTITDSHLSPDNQRMIYASVSNYVYMAHTLDSSLVQTPINFADPSRRDGRYTRDDYYGIWSCKFSADGNEVIAGSSEMVFVYDLLADKRTVKIKAHDDDINSCCWADTASGNVLVSASDDTFLKIWDRRSLGSSPKPSGVLIGHTEGITYVSAKGDGRYVISNGKDQALRLWDLRKMRSSQEFEDVKTLHYGIPSFDYRRGSYPQPKYQKHPLDCSVMQYTGHEVLRTLIRCHFSPAETTGGQYIYSGSADGRIHIWSLDGQVAQVLDRRGTQPMSFDPSGPQMHQNKVDRKICVRDVSWHSQQPILMSAGWLGSGWGMQEASIIARHEWKGLQKMNYALHDFDQKQQSERAERAQRRAMPGTFHMGPDDD